MEDLLVTLVIGIVLSGLWFMVRHITRTEEESRCHHHSGPNNWYLGGDEGRHDGCGTFDCQRRSKISPPGRSKTSPLNVMRYAVLGGCPGSP